MILSLPQHLLQLRAGNPLLRQHFFCFLQRAPHPPAGLIFGHGHNNVTQNMNGGFYFLIRNGIHLFIQLFDLIVLLPVALLGENIFQLFRFFLAYPDLAAQDGSHIGSVHDQRHGKIHQIGVAAIDIRLSCNGRVQAAVGIALGAHLRKSLDLPYLHAMLGKAAVASDGIPPVIHRHSPDPHCSGAVILNGLE